MLAYGGEWYWGIDRLPYLEAALATRLRQAGRARRHAAPRDRSRSALALSEKPLTCEMWFSFRSPYSYIALEQIERCSRRTTCRSCCGPCCRWSRAACRCRTIKRMYIVRDAKREADRLGHPVRRDVRSARRRRRQLHRARALGRRNAARCCAFAKSAMRGIWAEARDMAEYVDLRYVVERAELAVGGGQARRSTNARGAQVGAGNCRGSRGRSACGACRRSGVANSWRGAKIGCRCSPTDCVDTASQMPS